MLRTGAANFSASGLKRQDNDLIVIESAGAAASFKRNFDARFASGEAGRPAPPASGLRIGRAHSHENWSAACR
jgi:phosphatidylserine/phosphatidylglycerophosphate/cardiolipin synthase-like enzyme